MTRTITVIVSNICMCKQCGDVIESIHRHDFKYCGCGSIFVDGGKEYLRRGGKDLNDVLELSQYYEQEIESRF